MHLQSTAQISISLTPKTLKFPRVIRHRKAEVTIDGKTRTNHLHRIAWRANGSRKKQAFSSYAAANAKAKEVSQGNPVVVGGWVQLQPSQR